MVQPAPDTPPINGFCLGCLGLFSLGGAAMMIFGITFIRDAQASKAWPIFNIAPLMELSREFHNRLKLIKHLGYGFTNF